jgi:hypothetical protein
LALVWFQPPSAFGGVIINGTFSDSVSGPDPFPGWSTDNDSGFIAAVDGGGFASFAITGFFDDPVHLYQIFSLPSGATTLSFEFWLDSETGGSHDPVFAAFDSFQTSLFDSAGVPQFSILPGFLDAFYIFDAGGFEDRGNGVSVRSFADGVRRVTLDLSLLSAQDYIIDF